MTQQQAPWLEGKYGWNFGEGGWNTGMDQNILKFSFMFDRNVDSIVATLPAAVNGQAHYLTTDNRLYFAIDTTYFSTPVPKWFVIVVRSTGANWQYNGTSLIQIDNAQDIDGKLDDIELTVSSFGTAALEDVEFFATQVELDVAEATAASYTDELRDDLFNQIDPLKGSALVGYKGRGLDEHLGDIVSVKDFGAVGDGLADDYLAIQSAVTFVESKPLGGTVFFPSGTYLVSSGTITNDRSSNSSKGRVSFRGDGEFGSRIIYTGLGNDCLYIANNQDPVQEQSASYQSISDLTFIGPSNRALSSGITINLAAFIKVERVISTGFDFGMYLQDVDQSYFEKLSLRFNNRGLFSSKSPAPGLSSTQPNNHSYVSCTIANNNLFGGHWVGASAISFFGGDIEYNGAGAGGAGFGLKFEDSCYEGGVGANLSGVYFEGNAGISDLVLVATTTTWGPILSAVHNVHSCTFHRNGVNPNTNNINCSFGPVSTVGAQTLVVVGCAFKTFASYVPSAGTPAIGFHVTPADTTNFFDVGSYYESAVEKPAFIQNLNKKDAVITRLSNQSYATATTAKWLLDTVVAPTTLWTPTISSGDITIDEAGTYSVSVTAVFATAATGQKSLLISKNASVIAGAAILDTDQYLTCTTTDRFAAGDKISVRINQKVGVAQDVVGGGTSSSRVVITKLL